MTKLNNLSDIFKKYAPVLQMRSNAGLPYSVLVANKDMDSLPESFRTYEEADAYAIQLDRKCLSATVAHTKPFTKKPEDTYTLYLKPVTGFGSFSRD